MSYFSYKSPKLDRQPSFSEDDVSIVTGSELGGEARPSISYERLPGTDSFHEAVTGKPWVQAANDHATFACICSMTLI